MSTRRTIPHISLAVTVLTLTALVSSGVTQSMAPPESPDITDPAPALELEEVVQAPVDAAGLTMPALRGNVVVLNIWATHCEPCVNAIAHVNDLAQQFRNRPVRFIAITDEKRETIEDFLITHTMQTWIGLDTNRSVFRAYGIRSMPHMILIDRSGRIAARAHPMAVQAEHIEQVLNGELPEFGRGDANPNARDADQSSPAEPLFSITIRPGTGADSGMSGGRGKLAFNNQTLRSIVIRAWDTTARRLDGQFDRLDERFDVRIVAPQRDRDSVQQHLRYALQATFGLKVETVTRETNVYTLKLAGMLGPDLDRASAESGSFASSGDGRINLAGVKIDALARALEHALDRPVVDETGLDGRFDVRLNWTVGDTQSLKDALRRRLGLKLVAAQRPIRRTVVRVADSDTDGE